MAIALLATNCAPRSRAASGASTNVDAWIKTETLACINAIALFAAIKSPSVGAEHISQVVLVRHFLLILPLLGTAEQQLI